MKKLLTITIAMLGYYATNAQYRQPKQYNVQLNAGPAYPVKINYATNKLGMALTGKVFHVGNVTQLGAMFQYNYFNSSDYQSILELGLFANFRINTGESFFYKNGESYFYFGPSGSYGMGGFSNGFSIGGQLGYAIQVTEQFFVTLETTPRYYNYTVNETRDKKRWVGDYEATGDRFIIIPMAIGISIKLPQVGPAY